MNSFKFIYGSKSKHLSYFGSLPDIFSSFSLIKVLKSPILFYKFYAKLKPNISPTLNTRK